MSTVLPDTENFSCPPYIFLRFPNVLRTAVPLGSSGLFETAPYNYDGVNLALNDFCKNDPSE